MTKPTGFWVTRDDYGDASKYAIYLRKPHLSYLKRDIWWYHDATLSPPVGRAVVGRVLKPGEGPVRIETRRGKP